MKYIKYTSILLIVVSVIFTILFMAAPATKEDMGMVGPFLSWGYVLTGLAILLSVGLPLIDMIKDPKKLKKTGINLGLVLLVFLIALLAASPEALPVNMENAPAAGPTWKWTDAGLIMMYILAFTAFAAIIVGGLVNAIRNR